MSDQPKPARPRLVLCRGEYCNISRRADLLYERLQILIDDAVGDQYPRPIKLEAANCLDRCGEAPVLAVYPSGEVLCEVTPDQLDAIVDQALNTVSSPGKEGTE